MNDMSDNSLRTSFYKKNESLESVLQELNSKIANIEPDNFNRSKTGPIILIMGCPRAGSTILLQWLASLNIFSYPSNLIARFYTNPYLGIRIQQALLEFDPLNQLGFKKPTTPFESNLGKTIGALGPSEYWYFWRNYFNFDKESSVLSEEELSVVDGSSFLLKLSYFEWLTKMPLVMKGMLLNYHIKYLYGLNPKFLFVNLVRDPYYNAQSLLFAREKYFGDRNKWYSFKPPEYEHLILLDPIDQVAGQVVYTQSAVSKNLLEIPSENVLHISYSEFCEDPNAFLLALSDKYKKLGGSVDLAKKEFKINGIKNNNVNKLDADESIKLKEQLLFFKSLIKS